MDEPRLSASKRRRRGLGLDLLQLRIQPFDLALELLIASDQLIGILTLEIEVGIVHLGREGGAFGLFGFDAALDLLATLLHLVALALRLAVIDALRLLC